MTEAEAAATAVAVATVSVVLASAAEVVVVIPVVETLIRMVKIEMRGGGEGRGMRGAIINYRRF